MLRVSVDLEPVVGIQPVNLGYRLKDMSSIQGGKRYFIKWVMS